MNKTAQILILLAFSPLAYLMDGFVVMKLWNWIVCSLVSVPAISLIQAIGLCVIIWFTVSVTKPTSKMWQEKINEQGFTKVLSQAIGEVVGRFIVYLAFGWIVYLLL